MHFYWGVESRHKTWKNFWEKMKTAIFSTIFEFDTIVNGCNLHPKKVTAGLY